MRQYFLKDQWTQSWSEHNYYKCSFQKIQLLQWLTITMHNPVIIYWGPTVSCARYTIHMIFYPIVWGRCFIFLNLQIVANNLSGGSCLWGAYYIVGTVLCIPFHSLNKIHISYLLCARQQSSDKADKISGFVELRLEKVNTYER